jgi:uroporphyrin-III C-methyltransferase
VNLNFNQSNIKFKKGTVILAGAGPGNPSLITLKLKYIINLADVVIFDALVNKKILNLCKPNVKLIYAGKLKERKACTQSEINEWLLKYSKKNKKVLRLKGGDVSFFSRVSQEINFLKKNKIKTEILSGITSSQASLKSAGLSFFNKSNFCNFMTGHKIIVKKNKEVNYGQICKNKGKIIIYMGVSQISLIVSKLISNGINENAKVTLIQNASMESEKLFFTSLKKCPMFIKKNNVKSPSIIVIR